MSVIFAFRRLPLGAYLTRAKLDTLLSLQNRPGHGMSVTDCKDTKGEGICPDHSRKPYARPALKPLGQLKDVTASASGRANEPSEGAPGRGNPDPNKRRP